MTNISKKYPLIIIGSGPAGLTASIYASRYKIDHLVIGQALGGLAFEAHKICNFPTEQEISGMKLVAKMLDHVKFLGVTPLTHNITDIVQTDDSFKVISQNQQTFQAETLLLATGTKHRLLNLPNETEFIGKGVSYCATCDAMFYKNKTVAVVGGSDSANTASLYLANIAKKVYQIYRKDKLRGETTWLYQIEKNKKIEVIYNTNVIGLKGGKKLERIILSKPYRGKNEIITDGLFIEIGTIPQKNLPQKLSLETDKNGYIKVNSGQKTNREKIWAAGDATNASNNFRQIITACSQGAVAVENIYKFLQINK